MNERDRLLTIKDVAQLLQVHEQTVRGYVRNGRLLCVRLGRRAIRISQSDLEEFIRQHRTDVSED